MRRSRDVIQELLDEMQLISSYHPKVGRTEKTVDKLIDETAFFPGGTGLWRGENPHGLLPEYFPHAPMMFVAHNFGNEVGYKRACNKGGEAQYFFWQNLREYLRFAAVLPEHCFFTNALMGIKPDGEKTNLCNRLRHSLEASSSSICVGIETTDNSGSNTKTARRGDCGTNSKKMRFRDPSALVFIGRRC